MKTFTDHAKQGLSKLQARKLRLEGQLAQPHSCNCEFCTRKGEANASEVIKQKIADTTEEIDRITKYLKDAQ